MRRVTRSESTATRRSSSSGRVVRRNAWRVHECCGADTDAAATGGIEVADARREGRESCRWAGRRHAGSRGCTWYCRLACDAPRGGFSSRRRRAARGPCSSGPVRRSAYSRAYPRGAPTGLEASTFNVRTPLTLNTGRICRWSCRLAPTPARRDGPRCRVRAAAPPGRRPTTAGSGESGGARDRMTSRAALTSTRSLPRVSVAPVQRSRPALLEPETFGQRVGPHGELARAITGFRKALAELTRRPSRWFTSK